MQVRTCRGCNGAGVVNKVPNAMVLHPIVGFPPEVSVCLCDSCGGSRREIKEHRMAEWSPHPREHIDL